MQKNFELKYLNLNFVKINTTIFVILSFFFFYFIHSKSINQSGLDTQNLISFLVKEGLFLPVLIYAAYVAYKGKKGSLYILGFVLLVISAFLINDLIITGFDKIHLSLVFFYIITAFYFYQVWAKELEMACYNPSFSMQDLDFNNELFLKAKIETHEKVLDVDILNWDEDSCFILLRQPMKLSGEVDLNIHFENFEFKDKFRVVSEYGDYQGVGLQLVNNKVGLWKNLYGILSERGILTEGI